MIIYRISLLCLQFNNNVYCIRSPDNKFTQLEYQVLTIKLNITADSDSYRGPDFIISCLDTGDRVPSV